MSIARSSLSFRVSRGKMRQLPYTYIRHANQEKDRASSIDGSVYAIRAIFFASLLVVVYHTKNPKNIVQIKQRRRDAIHTTQCASSAGVILTHVHTLPHTHTQRAVTERPMQHISNQFLHIMKWLDLRSEFLQRPRCHRHQVAKCAYTRA